MKIRELITYFGFKADVGALLAIDRGISAIKWQLGLAAGAATAAVAGIFGLVKATADAGDAARDGAQRLGITAEAYQELGYAASLSGATIADVSVGIRTFSQILDTARRKGGEAAEAFRQLKIDPKQITSTDQGLELIADRVAALPDKMKRAALMQQFFGRSAQRLIPLLNEGGAGIRRMRQEARDLGGVISTDTANAADEFNDSLAALKFAGQGLIYTLGAELLPVLTDLTQELTTWWKANRKLVQQRIREWARKLATEARRLVRTVRDLATRLQPLVDALGGWEGALRKVIVAAIAWQALRFTASILSLVQAVGALKWSLAGLRAAWLAAAPFVAAALFLAIALALEDIYVEVTGGQSAVRQYIDAWKDQDGALGTVAKLLDGMLLTIKDLRGQTSEKFVVRLDTDSGPGTIERYLLAIPRAIDALRDKITAFEIWLVASMRVTLTGIRTMMDSTFGVAGNFLSFLGAETAGHNVANMPRRATDKIYGMQKSGVYALGETARGLLSGWGLLGGRQMTPEMFSQKVSERAEIMRGGTVQVNINARTNASAEEIGQEVRGAINRAMQDTITGAHRNFVEREE